MPARMIGLIMSSMDSEPMIELYHGISAQANKYHFSTQGYVIYPSMTSSVESNREEFFQFQTIDFTKFDGLIVMLDTISDEQIRLNLLAQIEHCNIPIITIDCDIKNCIKINTTNYDSVKKMVFHLTDVHGKTKINYISGPDYNDESNLRQTAYKHAMRERRLSCEGRIYSGTFFVDDGKDALEFFAKNEVSRDFDAIVCGNDMGAISLVSELKKRGIRVPEDVAVTGFDNISEAGMICPTMTTITKDNRNIGILAVDLLKEIWDGKSVSPKHIVDSTPIFRESCGCGLSVHSRQYTADDILSNFAFAKKMDANHRAFIEAGTKCNTFEEYLSEIRLFIEKVNPGQFSLFIHDSFTELFELEHYPAFSMPISDGTTIRVRNVLLYANGQFLPLDSTLRNGLSEKPENNDLVAGPEQLPAMQFLNSPLHLQDTKIGFVVFANSEFPLMPTLYSNWLNSMNITISNISGKMMLTHLYQTDSLTGINNRFGLEYYWKKFTKEAQNSHSSICIIFSDLNGLKKINDIYGHEQGDFTIKLVADAFKSLESPRLKSVRYGGDEFLLLGVGFTLEESEALVDALHAGIFELHKQSHPEYSISVSTGIYLRPADSEESLDSCIVHADSAMYQRKVKFYESDTPSAK